MRNLEQAIADWRKRMAASGVQSPEALDELESHLRDEIDARRRSGATERDAFEAAILGMGDGSTLNVEFRKEPEPFLATLTKNTMVTLMIMTLLASLMHVPLWGEFQTLFLSDCLILSMVLPVIASHGASRYGGDPRNWQPTVMKGQIVMAAWASLIIIFPGYSLIPLAAVVISCAVYSKRLWRQIREQSPGVPKLT